MVLSHKFQPILQASLENQEALAMQQRFAEIEEIPENHFDMAANYLTCFKAFVNDSDNVDVKAGHKALLKNILVRDALTLTYFAMLTVRRQLGDNLLQISVVGRSSTGKSTIFENPMQSVGHNLTMDNGVGRYNLAGKTTILLHDINPSKLVKGEEAQKLKSACRCEVFQTKTLGKTNSIPAVFVLMTSNQKLMSHRFRTAVKDGISYRTSYESDLKPTAAVHEEDILAVASRYIEAFVRAKPNIPVEALPKSGVFTRQHAIVGLFSFIIDILGSYKKDDFYSSYLYLYALVGMSKNVHLCQSQDRDRFLQRIVSLMAHYQLTEAQKSQCMKYINASSQW
jgi:hypothetical protein